MTTLGDLAKRLFNAHRDFTVQWADPLGLNIATWEQLGERGQESWLIVATEAVKVGVEIQQEIERQDDERLLNDPDLQTSLGQMQRGEGRVLRDCE